MGPVSERRYADYEVEMAIYLTTRSRIRRALDWLGCNVVGGHWWMRLDDHPMHHKCPLCGRECIDWVW